RTDVAVRQLAHRARSHVQARRPRFDANPTTQREVTERFIAACSTGDLEALIELLAPDVELTGDGGGVVRAPVRAIVGADKVARFVLGLATRKQPENPALYVTEVNGQPALVVTSNSVPASVLALERADGRITDVVLVANAEKLGAVDTIIDRAEPVLLTNP